MQMSVLQFFHGLLKIPSSRLVKYVAVDLASGLAGEFGLLLGGLQGLSKSISVSVVECNPLRA